jgi:hypothetical protein
VDSSLDRARGTGTDGEGTDAPGGRGKGWTSKLALLSRHAGELSIDNLAINGDGGPVGLLALRWGLKFGGL